ncbi:MAG: YqhA family protein [Roseiarcus sp.]
MIKSSFEKILFASRWLLAPFYVALVFALLALLAKVGVRVYDLATQLASLGEESVLLAALGIVDLTLSASLIVIVILSGYINFVSRIDVDAHPDWPRWMADVDFSELKLKLMASIVAISAIKLLEAFMDVGHETDRDLAWQTGVLAVFVVSAVLLALADRIGHRGGGGR